MATLTQDSLSFWIPVNSTSKTVHTFTGVSGATGGLKISQVKFEGSGYLSPNGAGRTFTITLTGSTSGSITLVSTTITNPSKSIMNAVGNNGIVTVNNTVIKGNPTLSCSVSGNASSSVGFGFSSAVKVTITYTLYQTNCTAPTSVSVSRVRSVCTVSWSGATAGTNNAITGYGVLVNTSASATGATTVNSGTTATSLTSQPNGTAPTTSKTYYFGVRAQSSYNNSDYKWSSAITVPAKPTVTAGTAITDTQMDNLRTWINTSGITDIADGAKVVATAGNTYRSGLTAGTSKIEASWYNAASTG